MSRDISRPEQIAITYTVPSQENEYFQARITSAGSSGSADPAKRRKRSESRDEDDDEGDGDDDDDEYLPEGDARMYAGSRSRAASSSYGHQQSYGAASAGGGSGGGQNQHQHQQHSHGEPYELSIPPHDPSAGSSGLTVPSMGGHSGSGSGIGTGLGMDANLGMGMSMGMGMGADAGADGKKSGSSKQMGLGPDGLPPPKKKRRRQALSCTGKHGWLPSFFSLSFPILFLSLFLCLVSTSLTVFIHPLLRPQPYSHITHITNSHDYYHYVTWLISTTAHTKSIKRNRTNSNEIKRNHTEMGNDETTKQ